MLNAGLGLTVNVNPDLFILQSAQKAGTAASSGKLSAQMTSTSAAPGGGTSVQASAGVGQEGKAPALCRLSMLTV